MTALKRDQSLDGIVGDLVPLNDYYELVGLKDMLTHEESYDVAAHKIAQKRAAAD